MSSLDNTDEDLEIGRPEKLDPPKKPVGWQYFSVTVPMVDLPDELVEAVAANNGPYRFSPQMRKKMRAMRIKEHKAKRKAWHAKALAKAEARPRKAYRVKGDTEEKILALAGDWITQYELRTAIGRYRGIFSKNLNRLWHEGKLLKRKNPAWSGVLGWGAGVARCVYQFKRASCEKGAKEQG